MRFVDELDAASSGVMTRIGRTSRQPQRLMYTEMGGTAVDLAYLARMAEVDCSEVNFELSLVGAGIGGGFDNTQELGTMTLAQALNSPDANRWAEEIVNKHMLAYASCYFRSCMKGSKTNT